MFGTFATDILLLSDLKKNGLPTGITLVSADNLREWFFDVEVLGESVFAGETFRIRFVFGERYPWDAPEVVFLVDAPKFRAPEVSFR